MWCSIVRPACVEHSGVRVRQRAGTLERVVKYDKDEGLGLPSGKPSDDEGG